MENQSDRIPSHPILVAAGHNTVSSCRVERQNIWSLVLVNFSSLRAWRSPNGFARNSQTPTRRTATPTRGTPPRAKPPNQEAQPPQRSPPPPKAKPPEKPEDTFRQCTSAQKEKARRGSHYSRPNVKSVTLDAFKTHRK